MKSSLLLGALLLAAACSSSSSPPDANPADAAGTVDVASGDGGPDLDTWDNWAGGFFAKYCVECHGVGNTSGLDFGVQATVVANQSTIRCGVCAAQDPSWGCPASPPAKQFPISDTAGTNPKPSDAERDRVVAWIEAGCP
ncbi:MAG TPA: hypothetical protein VGL81_07735 [Polyangiaceae bacterium]|jgi:hypothetical protein